MELMFDAAKCGYREDGMWLGLHVARQYMRPARQFVAGMDGSPYVAELRRYRRRRSPDANAYFWTLCGKLSAVLHIPPVELYRQYIREIGDNFEVVGIQADAVAKWCAAWQSRGLGWLCDDLGPGERTGFHNVVCYYGSSTYDTRQMSCLIDCLVEDCKAQGVETLTPRELSAMKEAWRG